jgi:hypothetical protein
MQGQLDFSRPSVLAERVPVQQLIASLFAPQKLAWEAVLLFKIQFRVTSRGFNSDLLLLFTEASMNTLKGRMDVLLRNL